MHFLNWILVPTSNYMLYCWLPRVAETGLHVGATCLPSEHSRMLVVGSMQAFCVGAGGGRGSGACNKSLQ